MKNYVDKWFSDSSLLPKFKEERTEVIFKLSFTLIAYKSEEHLNFSNIFSYLFDNYDVTSWEKIHSFTFWKYAKCY